VIVFSFSQARAVACSRAHASSRVSRDESLILSVCGSGGSLSHDHGVVLLPLGGGGDGLLPIDSGEVGVVIRYSWQDGSG
jgi:hypothetical protein